jgi:hypothetical protein
MTGRYIIEAESVLGCRWIQVVAQHLPLMLQALHSRHMLPACQLRPTFVGQDPWVNGPGMLHPNTNTGQAAAEIIVERTQPSSCYYKLRW